MKRYNFLVLVVDDMGFSDLQPFGGEIRTPRIQQLAERGARFRGFHTSSLCAPTRAMLLSGCDNHTAGMGVMQPGHAMNQYMKPGYEGYLNLRVPTIAEMLRPAGYHTYLAGKWHVGITDQTRPAARGFDRSFAFLGGGVSYFDDARPLSAYESRQTLYAEDDRFITDELPDGFYATTAYVDKMLEYIGTQGDDEPFFGYLAFTAPHDPLQVPDAWLDRCRGRYDEGYDAVKAGRVRRMRRIGLIDDDVEANPGSGLFRTWQELSDQERVSEARKMEIYASMIELLDTEVGRLLDQLEAWGKLEDTVVFLLSDNGANPKQPFQYRSNTPEYIQREFDNSLENYGRKGSFIAIGGAWAEATNTPLSYFKFTTYEGGIQTPLIVAGGPIHPRGVVTDQLLHVADLAPTILEFAGVERPSVFNDEVAPPLYGRSMVALLTDAAPGPLRSDSEALCFEMLENKSVVCGPWKLVLAAPPYGDGTTWRLFNLAEDPRELVDLADELPEKLAELRGQWDAYADRVGYIRSDGTRAVEELGGIDRFYEFRPADD